MAHTTAAPDGTTFIHDGGFEGPVEIVRVSRPSGTVLRMVVPFDDLKYFVAQYVAHCRIEELENADADVILGV